MGFFFFFKKISIFGCGRCWPQGQSTNPSLPNVVLAVAPRPLPLLPSSHAVSHTQEPLRVLQRLSATAWSCWCARVCTKAVPHFSDARWTCRTNTGSPSTHAVLGRDAPAFWRSRGAAGPAVLQKAPLPGCSLKIVTIFYSSHLSSLTKTPPASDLTDLFSTSVGLLLTQTWLCIINLNTLMNLPLNKYFKGGIKFHSVLLSYVPVFLFNFHTRCLS